MHKSELVAAIAEKAEMSKKDAEKALKAFEEVVTETLALGDKVQLVGDICCHTTAHSQCKRRINNNIKVKCVCTVVRIIDGMRNN